MRLVRLTFLITAFGIAAVGHAQSCSGGIDGGMDATGNQCNDRSMPSDVRPTEDAGMPAVARGSFTSRVTASPAPREARKTRSATLVVAQRGTRAEAAR